MPRRTDTRDRVLRTAAELFRTQGYHGTGLNQILEEGAAPKGSLYFHFPGGKEQLAIEAVGLGAAQSGAVMAELLDAAPDAASGVAAVISALAAELEGSGFRSGCPVATIAEDTVDNDAIRSACADAFEMWRAILERFLVRHGAPADLAVVMLAAVEGARVLARNQKDAESLYAVGRHLTKLVQKGQ
jgi:TetR/AcrR family transcriptional regulator, lmrAB and yxaGH operons repressor